MNDNWDGSTVREEKDAFHFPTANQMETASIIHPGQLSSSYAEAPPVSGSTMAYMNYPSFGNSRQQRMESLPVEASDTGLPQQERLSSHEFSTWRNPRNEMFMMHQMNGPSSIINEGMNLQGQGLSLSLRTEISSELVQDSNPRFTFLGLNSATSSNGVGQDSSVRELENPSGKETRNAEFTPDDFHYGNQDETNIDPSPCEIYGATKIVPSSKYLKAIQQLLDEVVNVRKVLEQPRSKKSKDEREVDEGSKDENTLFTHEDKSSNLSSAERQDLREKHIKLLTMSDEIDRRYKEYYNQMQILETSFDFSAGYGAARAYTALALQAISRHFRCLRDVINGQIRAAQSSLGDQDGVESKGNRIPRLRYVDQQPKQQEALQQLSVLQPHTWRPQRGLPESSVSILRAWLFEHFLHPYPKDSDKIMLARQTGLSRSQVSNWFINARVRLWKPMIEEIYKEEINSLEMNSSPENPGATNSEIKASDYRTEDLQQCTSSAPRSTDLSDLKTQKSIHGEETKNRVLRFCSEQSSKTDGSTYLSSPSLQLGLQHHEILVATTEEASSEAASFQFPSSEHQQQRFGSSYLRDFVG